jgi:hypothetical protein
MQKSVRCQANRAAQRNGRRWPVSENPSTRYHTDHCRGNVPKSGGKQPKNKWREDSPEHLL